jgi:hypothetical protein
MSHPLKRPSQDPVAIGSNPGTIDFIQGPKKKTAKKQRLPRNPSITLDLDDEVTFYEANEYNKVKKAFVVPAMEAPAKKAPVKKKPKPAKKVRVRKKCPHGRQKGSCRECGGSGFCDHGRHKNQCRECGGSGFCVHGRQKGSCKECGGSGFCDHGRKKGSCLECMTMSDAVASGLVCLICCETRTASGMCRACF